MNKEINYFEHFYKESSQDTNLLEKNAHDYPYSSLAGFLLLYHYKKTNHPGFEKLSKKTALYFKNLNWLQFLLDQTSNDAPAQDVVHPGRWQETGAINEINNVAITEIKTSTAGNFYIPRPDGLKSGVPEILPEKNIQEKYAGTADTPEPHGGEISFEPLHTVDYFASQGIKLSEDPEPSDKLGNQVKSFTAWLKSMKKLHPLKFEEQDPIAEKLIQNSAEESNVTTEVLTEAMAEVLIKQDKKEKAIEMYNKLSLIYPSKSAYFAAKIDHIKSS